MKLPNESSLLKKTTSKQETEKECISKIKEYVTDLLSKDRAYDGRQVCQHILDIIGKHES